MKNRAFYAWLVAIAVLIPLARAGVAQVGGSPVGGAGSSRTSPNTAAHGGGVTVVSEDFVRMKLAPGFMVSLTVLDDPDFTGSYRIDDQGNIDVPILGTLHVAGATVSEARVLIRNKLMDDQILKDPQVELMVLEYAAPEVTIIGEVGSPGRYPLLASRSLVDVLALAGGPTSTAGNEVEITHGSGGGEPEMVHYSKAISPKEVGSVIVSPGDTVRVKRAGIVYVLGSVARPGGYVMHEEGTITLLQAMSMAGGTAVAASTGTIILLRRNADGTEEKIALPYNKIVHGKVADVQLHATDVVYVSASTIKTIYVNTQQVMNTAASAAIYTTLIY